MPWNGVRKRFSLFDENVQMTPSQISEGQSHYMGVIKSLNKHYYFSNSSFDNTFLTGSWGKEVCTRPPRDIDIYFNLPLEVYTRFEGRSGNKQSQILQEIKGILQATYSATRIKGDGPVVLVDFNRMSVEVIPCFLLDSGQYAICITSDGGSYKRADPKAELNSLTIADLGCSGNLRKMIMMAKAWQSYCNVPIKSFYLELLLTEFLSTYTYRNRDYFWYDWLFRDFFNYLVSKSDSSIIVPGTHESINIGHAWKTKAETALRNARNACEDEYHDLTVSAGGHWQNIFGTEIPKIIL